MSIKKWSVFSRGLQAQTGEQHHWYMRRAKETKNNQQRKGRYFHQAHLHMYKTKCVLLNAESRSSGSPILKRIDPWTSAMSLMLDRLSEQACACSPSFFGSLQLRQKLNLIHCTPIICHPSSHIFCILRWLGNRLWCRHRSWRSIATLCRCGARLPSLPSSWWNLIPMFSEMSAKPHQPTIFTDASV